MKIKHTNLLLIWLLNWDFKMFEKLKEILGLVSLEEKAKKYIQLQDEMSLLKSEIDELAEEYREKSNMFKKSFEQPENENILDILKAKETNYLASHTQEIARLKKDYLSIDSKIADIEKSNPEIKEAVNKIKEQEAFKIIRKAYSEGNLSFERFNDIIKAKTGVVKYSDVIVFNNEGKVLFLRRNKGDGFAPDVFGLPGGHQDFGENDEQAAIRELNEETGITLSKEQSVKEVGKYEDSKASICYYQVNFDKATPEVTIYSNEHYNFVWEYWDKMNPEEMIPGLYDNLKKIYQPVDNIVEIKKALEGTELGKRFEDILKARGGVYSNTYENRKLGRVGQKYGGKKEKESSKEESNNSNVVNFNKNDKIKLDGANYIRYQNNPNIQTSIHPYPTKETIHLYKNEELVKEALNKVKNEEIEWDNLTSIYDPKDFEFKDGYVASLNFDSDEELNVSGEKFKSAPSAHNDYVVLFEGGGNEEKIFDGVVTKMTGVKAIYKKNKDNSYTLIEKDGKKVKINNEGIEKSEGVSNNKEIEKGEQNEGEGYTEKQLIELIAEHEKLLPLLEKYISKDEKIKAEYEKQTKELEGYKESLKKFEVNKAELIELTENFALICKGFVQGKISTEYFEKAKAGYYKNTLENRKLNRVGQKYGSKELKEVLNKIEKEIVKLDYEHGYCFDVEGKEIFNHTNYDPAFPDIKPKSIWLPLNLLIKLHKNVFTHNHPIWKEYEELKEVGSPISLDDIKVACSSRAVEVRSVSGVKTYSLKKTNGSVFNNSDLVKLEQLLKLGFSDVCKKFKKKTGFSELETVQGVHILNEVAFSNTKDYIYKTKNL